MEIKNSWMGTPAEVSQLPEPVRQYVRKLEVENAKLCAYKEAAENQKSVGIVYKDDSWCGGGELHAQVDIDLPPGTILYANPVPSHRQQSAAILDEAIDVLTELMDLMQGVIEGEYKPDSLTLQPARIFMNKLKFGDRCPSHQSAKYAAFVEEAREARRLWMDMYPPEDGRDCVTPFDQFLYVDRCPSHESEQGGST